MDRHLPSQRVDTAHIPVDDVEVWAYHGCMAPNFLLPLGPCVLTVGNLADNHEGKGKRPVVVAAVSPKRGGIPIQSN